MSAGTRSTLACEIKELWRHPVSSIGGERIATAQLQCDGLVGDRKFALIDAENGFAAAPEMDKRWRRALYLYAHLGNAGLPEIFFPSGERVAIDDRSINQLLREYFGFAVAVAAVEPNTNHGSFPTTQHRHPHASVHAITTGSMAHLAELCGISSIESRRFRPTAVFATMNDSRFSDNDWIGKRYRLGSTVELLAKEHTKRCGMTFVAQPGLDENPEILRGILRNNRRNFGVNFDVLLPGTISVGDKLTTLA